MTPKEAFERCVSAAFIYDNIRSGPHSTPGEVVQRMCRKYPELKKALQNLTSDEVSDVRQEDLY